jgi:putative copper export protein
MFDEAMAWWYHAASFLYLVGLLLTLGTAAAPFVLSRGLLPGGLGRHLALAGPVVLAAGVAARLLAQVQSAFGEMGGVTAEFIRLIVFETPWGWGWRWQAATAAAVLLSAAVGLKGVVALPAALAATTAAALTGHAVAFDEQRWLMVPVHAAHVAGAGLWMGTLAVLLVELGRIGLGPADPAARRGAVAIAVARFSSLAVVAVGLTVVSGVIAAVLHLGSWEALWTTAYGRALLIKVGLFVAAGACGAYNWQRVRPALAMDDEAQVRLRRIGGLETALGVLVLAITSLLVALPMPAESVFDEDFVP